MDQSLPYGWRDFDEEVVGWLTDRNPEHVAQQADGGMTCPLALHERERLRWKEGKCRKGTRPHGDPEVSFRVSPTYVLQEARHNFIAGLDLIKQITDGAWGKAETWRLGNENSEDALTWNVFRSLQEARHLEALVPLLCDCREPVEPDLFLWGRRITETFGEQWKRLAEARGELERGYGHQTEPDAVLHIEGWGWVFIEAKFGSRVTTPASDERMRAWIGLYPSKAPWLFDLGELGGVPRGQFPEQLLRNVVFADRIAGEGERAHVVLLAREKELTPVEEWLGRCLSTEAAVTFSRLSWEQIYRALPDRPMLTTLRRYLEGKSYCLRPAFAM